MPPRAAADKRKRDDEDLEPDDDEAFEPEKKKRKGGGKEKKKKASRGEGSSEGAAASDGSRTGCARQVEGGGKIGVCSPTIPQNSILDKKSSFAETLEISVPLCFLPSGNFRCARGRSPWFWLA